MEQKKKIEMYVEKIYEFHQKDPSLRSKMINNYTEYEQFMIEKLPKFKEKYPTLFKMAIQEFDKPSFSTKLKHFLIISQSVLNGKTTLDAATKQVAQEQFDEYVAPIVANKNSS